MNQEIKNYIKTSVDITKNISHENNEFVMGIAGDADSLNIWYSGNKPMMIIGITRLIEEMRTVLGSDSDLTFGQIMSLILDEHEANVCERIYETIIQSEQENADSSVSRRRNGMLN